MIILVAVDRKGAIGKDNGLLYRVPEDLKNFKALTTGNVVVMGRKTLESFPGGKLFFGVSEIDQNRPARRSVRARKR